MARVITVLGSTGTLGRQVVGELLARGHRVRAVGRTAVGLEPLTTSGAEAWVGSVDEAVFLTEAFRGADAAFLLAPMKFDGGWRDFQLAVAAAYVRALPAAGLSHVVNMSGVGAQVEGPTGPILGLRRIEQALDSIDGLNVLHLRAASFMENLMMNIPMIAGRGMMASGVAPDVPLALIATADIAARAAAALDSLEFRGSGSVELLGPRDHTMTEVATILGGAIGLPDLAYLQAPYEVARGGMVEAGLASDAADLLVEMHRAYNEGVAVPGVGRNATTATPTSLEHWAERVFSPAFKAAG